MFDSPEYIDNIGHSYTPALYVDPEIEEWLQDRYGRSQESRGFWGDIKTGLGDAPKEIARGAGDVFNQASSLTDHVWDWLGTNIEPLRGIHETHPDTFQFDLEESESVTGSMIRDTTKFLLGFIPALRGVKLLGLTGKLAAPMVAGAITDATVFDPMEARLSNLIQNTALENPVTEWLAADEDDTELEGRVKNAIEGLGLGLAGEGLLKGLRAFRKLKKAAPEMVAQGVDETGRVAVKGTDLDVFDATAVADVTGGKAKLIKTKISPKGVDTDKLLRKIRKGEYVGDDFDSGFNPEYINTEEDVHYVLQVFQDTYTDFIRQAKGGEVSKQADAKALAELLGTEEKVLLSNRLFQDTQNLDAKVFAVNQLLAGSAKRIDDLISRVADPMGDTTANWVKLRRMVDIHAGIQAQVKGTQTNIARALNMYKVGRDGMLDQNALEEILSVKGGKRTIRKWAQNYKRIPAGAKRNKFIRDTVKAKTVDAIQFYWINSILSGPHTAVVNILGNAAVQFMDLVEHSVAATANVFRGGKGEITFTEVGARTLGMLQGLFDAFKLSSDAMSEALARTPNEGLTGPLKFLKEVDVKDRRVGNAWKAFAKDAPVIDPRTTQENYYRAISGAAFGAEEGSLFGKTADFLGAAIGIPGRVLVTTDEIFKTMAYRSELAGQAVRAAVSQGGDRSAIKQTIREFLENPPQHLTDTLTKRMRHLTFQDDLGEVGQKFQRLTNSSTPLKFVFPFVRTPVNIMKYVSHRTPIARSFSSQIKADIAAGGARAELAKAKLATGSALFAMGTTLAAMGKITGGADDKNREQRYLIGQQPYAFKIGNKTISFSRSDPFGTFFGLCADFVEVAPHLDDEEYTEFASAAVVALSRNIMSKTYLKGLTDIVTALNEPGRFGERFVANFVGGFIPNFLNQVNTSYFDAQVKEMNSISDGMKKRIPGASKAIPPKRHPITGEAVQYGQGLLGGLLPFWVKEEKQDPALQEMFRLKMAVGDLPKAINGVDLSPEEYDAYQIAVTKGETKPLLQVLNQFVHSREYQSIMYDEGKSDAIKRVISRFRAYGRKKFLREHPDVYMKVMAKKREDQYLSKARFG